MQSTDEYSNTALSNSLNYIKTNSLLQEARLNTFCSDCVVSWPDVKQLHPCYDVKLWSWLCHATASPGMTLDYFRLDVKLSRHGLFIVKAT